MRRGFADSLNDDGIGESFDRTHRRQPVSGDVIVRLAIDLRNASVDDDDGLMDLGAILNGREVYPKLRALFDALDTRSEVRKRRPDLLGSRTP